MEYLSNFVDNLVDLIKEKELSNQELSNDLGVNISAVHKWLRAETLPNVDTLIKLSNYFKTDMDYLLGRTKNNNYNKKASKGDISTEIKKRLKSKQISAYKLAKDLDIYPAIVYQWINKIYKPNLDSLIKLADYFDCTIDELLGLE